MPLPILCVFIRLEGNKPLQQINVYVVEIALQYTKVGTRPDKPLLLGCQRKIT